MRKILGFLLLLSLSITSPAMAEETTDKANTLPTFTLGDIVVTAEREAPQTAITDVFTEEDINATHALTLGEALSYMPGITVTTARKDEPRVYMNGFNLKRILVLIDGVPYYEGSTGNLDLNMIPTAVISRIEVVKGAASALYGPNAMGGVIKVYTKKGSDQPFVSGYAEAGKYDTYNIGAAAGGSYNKVSAWLSVDHRTSNGWDLSGDYKSSTGTLSKGNNTNNTYYADLENCNKRENSDRDTTSVWTRVGVDLDRNSEYYASFHYITTDGGIPHSVETNNIKYNTDSPQSTQFNRWKIKEEIGVDLSGKQEIFDNFILLGKLYYHYHYDQQEQYFPVYDGKSSNQNGHFGNIGWPGGGGNTADPSIDFYGDNGATATNKDTMLGGQIIADWKIDDMHTIRGSFQFREDNHKEKGDKWAPWADYTSRTGSAGFEYQLSLFENKLVITPGISYDWFEVTDAKQPIFGTVSNKPYFTGNWNHPKHGGVKDSFNPMIGVNYQMLENTMLYGSVAKKTGFPTLKNLAYADTSANDKLDPEETINYTLGVSQGFFENRLQLSLAGFFNDISDMITSDYSANGVDKRFYNNEDVHVYGFQTGALFKATENISFMLDYTYNEARNRSSDRLTNKVTGVIKHKVDMGASFYMPDIAAKFDIRGTYIGDWYKDLPTPKKPDTPSAKVSSYFTADVKFTKFLFDEHLQVYGVVKNIFDKDYELGPGFPGHGRSFLIGTRVTF